MKRAVLTGLLLAASLLAAPAVAQTAAPTPRAMELSRRYIAAANMESMMDMVSATLAQQFALTPGSTTDSRLMNDAMIESMRAMQPMVLDRYARIFATKFTEPELEGLVTFYESPVGRSVTIKSAELGPEMGALMSELVPALNADLARRVCTQRPGSEVCNMARQIAQRMQSR